MSSITKQSLSRAVRRICGVELILIGLLCIAMGNIALGVGKLVQQLNTNNLIIVATSGVLIGWLLAYSHLPGWFAMPMGVFSGFIVLWVSTGRLANPLIKLLETLLQLVTEFIRNAYLSVLNWWQAWFLDTPPAFSVPQLNLQPADTALDRLVTINNALATRLVRWLQVTTAGQSAFDSLVTVLIWSFIFWLLAIWAAWYVRRLKAPLLSMLPSAVLLTLCLYYTQSESGISNLLFFAGFVLLIHTATNLSTLHRRWSKAYPILVYSPFDAGLAVSGMAIFLMLVASLTPSLSPQEISRAIERILSPQPNRGENLAESLGLVSTPVLVPLFEAARSTTLPAKHLIGSSAELSKQVKFYVTVSGYQPTPPSWLGSQLPDIPPLYYWRSRTYDLYNGRGWYTAPVTVIDYPAFEPLRPEVERLLSPSHQVIQQSIRFYNEPDGFLYVTGELVTAEPGFRAAWHSAGDLFGVQIYAQQYIAISQLPFFSVSTLRNSGTNYPDEIRRRYFQLPEALPLRVRELALELTLAAPTPYDQVKAIEQYLRTIPYSVNIPTPPTGRDVVDYFLFDLQQGYCDYYATAMAVLARSVGIPSRLVTGFASGIYNPPEGRFIVTEADAHSWVEIYFPGYGWVEFEPTGNRPPIERDEQQPTQAILSFSLPAHSDTESVDKGKPLWVTYWFSIAPILTLVVFMTWYFSEHLRLKRLPPLALLLTLYEKLHRLGRMLHLPTARLTPHEFSTELQQSFYKVTLQRVTPTWLPTALQDVQILTELYTRALFSQQPAGEKEKTQALQLWQNLRHVFWHMQLFKISEVLRRIFPRKVRGLFS